jgi:hypothetical protein
MAGDDDSGVVGGGGSRAGSGSDTTYSGGGSSTDTGSGVTGDDGSDSSYSGGDTSTSAPTGSTGSDDPSGGGGSDNDDSGVVGGGGDNDYGGGSDTTYSGGGSSTDTGSGVTGDGGGDTSLSGGETTTQAPEGQTGTDDTAQRSEERAQQEAADRLDGSADRGVSITREGEPGDGGQLERSQRAQDAADSATTPTERRQQLAQQVAAERDGVEADDITVTSTASGYQAVVNGGGRDVLVTGGPEREPLETEIRRGETADRGVGITRGPEGASVVTPSGGRQRRGEPVERTDISALTQAQRDTAASGPGGAPVTRAEVRGDPRAGEERFGDIDWSFGLGGSEDEVERAVDSLPDVVREGGEVTIPGGDATPFVPGTVSVPGTRDAETQINVIESRLPEQREPATASVTAGRPGNVPFAREGANQARNIVGAAEGVAALPSVALETVELATYTTGGGSTTATNPSSALYVNPERSTEVASAGTAVAGQIAEDTVENPRGAASSVLTEAGLAVFTGGASKAALVRTRGRLATRGMDFQGDVDFEDIERPDVRSGENRLTTFSDDAVPGGKRSTDPDTFPVETAEGDPAQELRTLAREFDDPQVREALNAQADEVTLFSARSGVKSERFEPRSRRPYDPDAGYFAGSVSRNFLDVDGTPETRGGGVRRPQPVAAARSLVSAARREDTPTIVATAGRVRELPDDVRTREEITSYLQEQRNTGEFFVRQSDNQSGEAEAIVSAEGADSTVTMESGGQVYRPDETPGTAEVESGEATEFVEVGDPLQTEVRGERVPIQAFRQNTGDVTALSQQGGGFRSFLSDERGMAGAGGRRSLTRRESASPTTADELLSEPSYRPGGATGTPLVPTPVGAGVTPSESTVGTEPSGSPVATTASGTGGFGRDLGVGSGIDTTAASTTTVGPSGPAAGFEPSAVETASETTSGVGTTSSPTAIGSSPSTTTTTTDEFGLPEETTPTVTTTDGGGSGRRADFDFGTDSDEGVVDTGLGGDEGRFEYDTPELI